MRIWNEKMNWLVTLGKSRWAAEEKRGNYAKESSENFRIGLSQILHCPKSKSRLWLNLTRQSIIAVLQWGQWHFWGALQDWKSATLMNLTIGLLLISYSRQSMWFAIANVKSVSMIAWLISFRTYCATRHISLQNNLEKCKSLSTDRDISIPNSDRLQLWTWKISRPSMRIWRKQDPLVGNGRFVCWDTCWGVYFTAYWSWSGMHHMRGQ
jgi:hypothetical protein